MTGKIYIKKQRNISINIFRKLPLIKVVGSTCARDRGLRFISRIREIKVLWQLLGAIQDLENYVGIMQMEIEW